MLISSSAPVCECGSLRAWVCVCMYVLECVLITERSKHDLGELDRNRLDSRLNLSICSRCKRRRKIFFLERTTRRVKVSLKRVMGLIT